MERGRLRVPCELLIEGGWLSHNSKVSGRRWTSFRLRCSFWPNSAQLQHQAIRGVGWNQTGEKKNCTEVSLIFKGTAAFLLFFSRLSANVSQHPAGLLVFYVDCLLSTGGMNHKSLLKDNTTLTWVLLGFFSSALGSVNGRNAFLQN